jgi:hypothetical protein
MPNKIDLTGKRFGWLLVIKEIGRNKSEKILWLCKCRCGKEKVIDGGSLRNGDTVSCSCKKSSTHRKTKTKEYRIWADMIQRCHNPKCGNYKYYGLRGIKVCDEWRDSFEVFLKDMGKRPSVRHSIDRIDVNIEYVLKENVNDIVSDAESKERAKTCWKEGNKLEAVKIVYKFCNSLKQSKEYCEMNFNHN